MRRKIHQNNLSIVLDEGETKTKIFYVNRAKSE